MSCRMSDRLLKQCMLAGVSTWSDALDSWGIIASVMANVSRDPKRRPQPFTPQEFMPFLHREPASDDANNLTLRLRAAFARLPRA